MIDGRLLKIGELAGIRTWTSEKKLALILSNSLEASMASFIVGFASDDFPDWVELLCKVVQR